MSYPLEALRQEVAYIAYHFHWSRDEIFEFSHPERGHWVNEIRQINQRMNGQEE